MIAKHNRKIRIILVVIALAISYGVYGLFHKDMETWNDKGIDQLFALRTTFAGKPSPGQQKIVHVDANSYLNRPKVSF